MVIFINEKDFNMYRIKFNKKYADNIEAANNILDMFQYSGVFSKEMNEKIYSILMTFFHHLERDEDIKYKIPVLEDLKKQFHSIFECYNIFSDKFIQIINEKFEIVINVEIC